MFHFYMLIDNSVGIMDCPSVLQHTLPLLCLQQFFFSVFDLSYYHNCDCYTAYLALHIITVIVTLLHIVTLRVEISHMF